MALTNTNITHQGNVLKIKGEAIKVGQKAPAFTLTGNDLKDVKSESFAGKVLILSVVPSLDTPTCAIETKRFNKEAAEFQGKAVLLTVSVDLPFAQARWCGAEGVKNIVTASDYKYRNFGPAYGTYLEDTGLLTRAVFVIDANGIVQSVEYVDVLSEEPNYEATLKKVRELL